MPKSRAKTAAASGKMRTDKTRAKTAAETTGSPGAKAALLRSGGGKHDSRPKEMRTRRRADEAAIRDAS